MSNRKDITNQKFNRLTAIKFIKLNKFNKAIWLFQCDCEKERFTEIIASSVISGRTQSCGCLQKEINMQNSTKHGLSHHPLYKIWTGMKVRCYCKSNNHYINYGQRGIKVCEEWKNSFQSFYTWAIEHGWCNLLEINRINNDGDYCPDNCNFVSSKINCNNKRNNRKVIYQNKKYTIAELAEKYNLSWKLTSYRIKNKIPLEKKKYER